jgi:hypothetical protein
MKKMRRAQVYSLIAILLSIPVMLFIAYYVTESQNIRYFSLEKVLADQLHEVESSIEKDFDQAMSISGKRAFLAASDYVIREGTPLDNATLRIEELMTQGTIMGSPIFVMRNNTIQDWVDKIMALGLGFNVNVSYSNPSVSNIDGYNARLMANLDIEVWDYSGIARIQRNIVKEVSIPLTSLEDPIFPTHTLGFVGRSIRPYPYPYHAIKMTSGSGYGDCSGQLTFNQSDPDKANKILVINDATAITGFAGVVGEGPGIPAVSCHLVNAAGAVDAVNRTIQASGYTLVNIDNASGGLWSLPMLEAIEYGYYSYFPSDAGPDLFKRLEDDLSGSPGGVDTFVDKLELQSKGVTAKPEQVSLSYLYFSNQTINGQEVRGLQGHFRISAANAARYNLTELLE